MMRCRLRGLWETVTMGEFWRSLMDPPLVVFSGHIWPYQPTWSAPSPSPDPEHWDGLVEFDESRCLDCGHRANKLPWRKSWMS